MARSRKLVLVAENTFDLAERRHKLENERRKKKRCSLRDKLKLHQKAERERSRNLK